MKCGDVVRLKSGGTKMTINWERDGLAECYWFDGNDITREVYDVREIEPAYSWKRFGNWILRWGIGFAIAITLGIFLPTKVMLMVSTGCFIAVVITWIVDRSKAHD